MYSSPRSGFQWVHGRPFTKYPQRAELTPGVWAGGKPWYSVPTGPGLGIEIDEGALEELTRKYELSTRTNFVHRLDGSITNA